MHEVVENIVVNSYIFLDNLCLKRPLKYSIVQGVVGASDSQWDWMIMVIRLYLDLQRGSQIPLSVHLTQFNQIKRNCEVFYATTKKKLKVLSFCNTPQSQVCLPCRQKLLCDMTYQSVSQGNVMFNLVHRLTAEIKCNIMSVFITIYSGIQFRFCSYSNQFSQRCIQKLFLLHIKMTWKCVAESFFF